MATRPTDGLRSVGGRSLSRLTTGLLAFFAPLSAGLAEADLREKNAPEAMAESEGEFDHLRPDALPIQKGLPDPFLKADGERVGAPSEWDKQRGYLRRMLETIQYGRMPPKPTTFGIRREFSRPFADGVGVEERYVITLRRNGESCDFRMGLVRPSDAAVGGAEAGVTARRPTIIKNCYVFFDDDVYTDRGGDRRRPMEKISATAKRDRFAAEEALRRGYVLCKFLREDVASDFAGQQDKKIHALYPEYDWGCIAAWAWTYQVVIDALDRLGYTDLSRIAATGHSRGGKTTLWAAVCEPRIAATIPSASGSGGTSCFRYAEEGYEPQTVRHMRDRHPFWWTDRLFEFANNEFRLPYDGHTIRALVAPRPQLNTYGRHDFMTNPYGAQLTHEAAHQVYEWLGAGDRIAMHWREGGHAQSEDDWLALFDFVDDAFFDKPSDRKFNNTPFPGIEVPQEWLPPTRTRAASQTRTKRTASIN